MGRLRFWLIRQAFPPIMVDWSAGGVTWVHRGYFVDADHPECCIQPRWWIRALRWALGVS